jgi:hypothetical protein
MNPVQSIFGPFFKCFGVNDAVFYSLCLRGWQLAVGPVTLLLIVRFFSPTQQGFYYTFNSLLLLQIFFEMGLSYVLIQFSAHEFSRVKWRRGGGFQGGKPIRRVRELLTQSVKWYGLFAGLFLILVLPIGFYFLNSKDTGNLNFSWKLPWSLLVFSTAMSLLATPLLAVIEGSGRVGEIYRLKLMQTMVATILAWGVIALGGGLLNAAAVAVVNAVFVFTWLALKNPLLFRLGLNSLRCEKKFYGPRIFLETGNMAYAVANCD